MPQNGRMIAGLLVLVFVGLCWLARASRRVFPAPSGQTAGEGRCRLLVLPSGQGHGRILAERRLLCGGRLDINHASEEELQALPGIGRHLAQEIVHARPFGSTQELGRVHGIGRRKLAALINLVEVRP